MKGTVVHLLAPLLLFLAFLRYVSLLNEEGAERDNASDDVSWMKMVSCTCRTLKRTIAPRLTNGELAVEPEPGKSRVLHTPPLFTSMVIDVVKDAPSNNCDGYSEKDKAKNQTQNELLTFVNATLPQNGDWQSDNYAVVS